MSEPTVMQRTGYPDVKDHSGYTLSEDDFLFLGIDQSAAWACVDKEFPLGVPSAEFPFFVRGLEDALRRHSLHDADVRVQGSSGRFFSSALKPFPQTKPDRAQLFMAEYGKVWSEVDLNAIELCISKQWSTGLPGQRPFDSLFKVGLSPDRSDIDVQISSDLAFEFAREIVSERGVDPDGIRFHNPSYDFLIKEISDTEFLFLNRWAAEWQDRLDRGVSIAIFESQGPPKSGREVSSHFQQDDWVILGESGVTYD